MTPSLDQSIPFFTSCTFLTNSLRFTTRHYHLSKALKSKVHRTLWGTLLKVIQATQSLTRGAQLLVTQPATVHPQWRTSQTSQVHCEKGSATEKPTPRRNIDEEVMLSRYTKLKVHPRRLYSDILIYVNL